MMDTLFKKLAEIGLATAGQKIPQRQDHHQTSLSFAQQRLWFLQQLVSDNPAYNVVRAFRIYGNRKNISRKDVVAKLFGFAKQIVFNGQ
ncbi:hypothetical protein ACFL27_20940 [candidate division CSSED10-310 bacterium]|uniref:Uncharacterized protein n=1 Tax=candidate division CSSED10-310 bacterium TaxID=2855610 RepID=A0ABV6Z2Y8_UNCC1